MGNIIDSGLRFLRNMILTRILVPEEFGLMAIVSASAAVLEAFAEVGLRQSVIQNKRGADFEYLNVTWWFSVMRGIMLYSVAFFLAPYISEFYHKPLVLNLLRIGFIGFLFNGLVSPGVHVLQKELKFGRWIMIVNGSGFISVLIGIILGFYLRNVWALLIAYVIEAFLKVLLSFVLCPFVPQLRLDPECKKAVISFSRKMFGLPILTMLVAQTDVFVIGKVLSVNLLGMYSLAKGLAELASALISRVINPILLPSFSYKQDDREWLRGSLFWLTKAIATFFIPLLAFLCIFSKHVLVLVYGTMYGAVALPFSILCISTLLLSCSAIFSTFYMAIGKPNIHRTASIVRSIVLLSLIYPATVSLGLVGAAVTLLISVFLMIAVALTYAKKYLNFRIVEYLQLFIPGLKLSFIVLIPGILLIAWDFHIKVVLIGFGVLSCLIAWAIGIIKVKPFNRPMSIKNAVAGNDSV